MMSIETSSLLSLSFLLFAVLGMFREVPLTARVACGALVLLLLPLGGGDGNGSGQVVFSTMLPFAVLSLFAIPLTALFISRFFTVGEEHQQKLRFMLAATLSMVAFLAFLESDALPHGIAALTSSTPDAGSTAFNPPDVLAAGREGMVIWSTLWAKAFTLLIPFFLLRALSEVSVVLVARYSGIEEVTGGSQGVRLLTMVFVLSLGLPLLLWQLSAGVSP